MKVFFSHPGGLVFCAFQERVILVGCCENDDVMWDLSVIEPEDSPRECAYSVLSDYEDER